MVKFSPLSLQEIVASVSGQLVRPSDESAPKFSITELAEPAEARPGSVSFLISESYLSDLDKCSASVLVVQRDLLERVQREFPSNISAVVVCDDAYLGFARLTELIVQKDSCFEWNAKEIGTSNTEAKIDPTAVIGPGVVIGRGSVVGARVVLHANVVLGPNVQIGADSVLFPGVSVYARTEIGSRVRIHSNAVIGADGFGYAKSAKGSVKIWHLGRVKIGSDVEIGAGSCIDRGTISDTVVSDGAKIDNLVQIGHNGQIGPHAILCAQVGLAGGVKIGAASILAGKAGVADKLTVGDRAIVGPMTGLSKDVAAGEIVMGQIPGKPRRSWWKMIALLERLPELLERVKKLESSRT